MNNFKGYILVIVGGSALLAAATFTALQWGGRSTFSAYGPDVTTRTVWLVLGSAAGGLLVYWMGRMMIRGVRILWKVRREQQRALAEARHAQRKVGAERP